MVGFCLDLFDEVWWENCGGEFGEIFADLEGFEGTAQVVFSGNLGEEIAELGVVVIFGWRDEFFEHGLLIEDLVVKVKGFFGHFFPGELFYVLEAVFA